MKLVTIFFDLEGRWGSPYEIKSEEKILQRILDILGKFQLKAVFNTCGAVAEKYPKLIKEMHEEGHEIASHGYMHEDFLHLNSNEMDETLAKTEEIIREDTGSLPKGIRFPYSRYNKSIYFIVKKRGYKWVSNMWVPQIEQLYPPHGPDKFNPRHLIAKTICKVRWTFYKKTPYKVDGLLEIPQLSTNDCGLLGLPKPSEDSSDTYLNFGFNALKSQFEKSEGYFNLNFHPWVIGTANRLQLLDDILSHISRSQSAVKFTLPRQIIGEKINENLNNCTDL